MPHFPWSRVARSSSAIRRISPMIRPQVSSVGPSPWPGVPQTVIPRSVAASVSNEALRAPVVIRQRSVGSRSSRERGNAVRSRMPITMSKSASRVANASSSAR